MVKFHAHRPPCTCFALIASGAAKCKSCGFADRGPKGGAQCYLTVTAESDAESRLKFESRSSARLMMNSPPGNLKAIIAGCRRSCWCPWPQLPRQRLQRPRVAIETPPGPSSLPRPGLRGWPEGIHRAGLYARVSTDDQQTLPLKLTAMRDYVAKRGWTIALEVQD